METGHFNTLTVARLVDFGAYLADLAGNEVLLPTRYITTPLHPGDSIEVFVYTDGEDRPIATTLRPHATAGEVALLEVVDVNDTGAFLDWGIDKDLLVPYGEQRQRMHRGGRYLVYVFLDHVSQRVAATARLERYIGNVLPDYRRFAKIRAIAVNRTDLGWRAVVDNLHWGMIYDSELFGRDLRPGQQIDAWIRKIRPDGKLDLTLHAPAADRAGLIGSRITARMSQHGGQLDITDHSSPELIAAAFGCSKKDFKKALGALLRQGIVAKSGPGFSLLTAEC